MESIVQKARLIEQTSSQILKITASSILEDILAVEKNVFFTIHAQKNGRLRCRVMELAPWLPGRTFRTDWENLRKDFLWAIEDIRHRRLCENRE